MCPCRTGRGPAAHRAPVAPQPSKATLFKLPARPRAVPVPVRRRPWQLCRPSRTGTCIPRHRRPTAHRVGVAHEQRSPPLGGRRARGRPRRRRLVSELGLRGAVAHGDVVVADAWGKGEEGRTGQGVRAVGGLRRSMAAWGWTRAQRAEYNVPAVRRKGPGFAGNSYALVERAHPRTARTCTSRVRPVLVRQPPQVPLVRPHVLARPLARLRAVLAAPASGAEANAVLVVALPHAAAVPGAGLVVVLGRVARCGVLRAGGIMPLSVRFATSPGQLPHRRATG